MPVTYEQRKAYHAANPDARKKWLAQIADYNRKKREDPEYRRRESERALRSYYRRKAVAAEAVTGQNTLEASNLVVRVNG